MAERKYVWVAEMTSESEDWIAVGRTQEEALDALRSRWNKRAAMIRRDGGTLPNWDDQFADEPDSPSTYYDVTLRRLEIGKGYIGGDDVEFGHGNPERGPEWQ